MHIPFSIWGKHNLPDFGLALFPPGQNFCMKLWTVCWSLLLLLSSVFCCAWWASFSIIALMSPYNLLIAWSTAEASSNLSFWNKGLIQWQPPLHTFVQVEEVVCSIPKLSFVEDSLFGPCMHECRRSHVMGIIIDMETYFSSVAWKNGWNCF